MDEFLLIFIQEMNKGKLKHYIYFMCNTNIGIYRYIYSFYRHTHTHQYIHIYILLLIKVLYSSYLWMHVLILWKHNLRQYLVFNTY